MKRVFISLGMTGRSDDDVIKDIKRASENCRKLISRMFKDECEIVHNFDCVCEDKENAGKTFYLGEAIKKLGTCDFCYFVNGWEKHRGCHIEMEVCKRYEINTFIEFGKETNVDSLFWEELDNDER